MQKKLERLDFIIRDAYADGNITHEIHIEATEIIIDMNRQLKILNMPVVSNNEVLDSSSEGVAVCLNC